MLKFRHFIAHIFLAASFVALFLYFPQPNLSLAQDNVRVTLPVGDVEPEPQIPSIPAGDGVPPYIFNLQIKPDFHFASLSWETYEPAISRVNWGKTREYELGSLAGSWFLKHHETRIENLKDGSLYAFKITTIDLSGNQAVHQEFFWTLTEPKLELPPNVENFRVVPKESELILSWQNPVVESFHYVRVVRSEKYFPAEPKEGLVVYEGTGEAAVDSRVEYETKYFYAAYVYDKSGKISSGALASGILVREIPPVPPGKPSTPTVPPRDPGVPVPEAYPLTLTDFIFSQEKENISFVAGRISIDGDFPLLVSLPAEKFVSPGKYLLFALTKDGQDEGAYYLRYNPDKKYYEATIPSFDRAGAYNFSIQVLNSRRVLVKELPAELVVGGVLSKPNQSARWGQRYWLFVYNLFLLILFALLLLLLLFLRRRKNKK